MQHVSPMNNLLLRLIQGVDDWLHAALELNLTSMAHLCNWYEQVSYRTDW
jgi:hypothetical protein